MTELTWFKDGDDRVRPIRTTNDVRDAARAFRKSLPRPSAPREIEAWRRTIKREISGQVRDGGTATEAYEFALVTAVQLINWEIREIVAMTILGGDFWNEPSQLDPFDYRYGKVVDTTGLKGIPGTPEFSKSVATWYKRRLRHHYMDSLVPAFAERKKEHEAQKWFEAFLASLQRGAAPNPALPDRHVSDDQLVYMRGLVEKYGRPRGRPRVTNPSAATLRKRRQRERKRMLEELQAEHEKAEAALDKFDKSFRISHSAWLDYKAHQMTVGRKLAELCAASGMQDRADGLNEVLDSIA